VDGGEELAWSEWYELGPQTLGVEEVKTGAGERHRILIKDNTQVLSHHD